MKTKLKPLLTLFIFLSPFALWGQTWYIEKENVSCLYGYKDSATKNWVIHPEFSYANEFVHGRAIVGVNEYYGLIDSSGNTIQNKLFEHIGHGTENHFIFKNNGQYGVINRDANIVLPAVYSLIYLNEENLLVLRQQIGDKELRGLLNKHGKLIEPQFEIILSFISSISIAHGVEVVLTDTLAQVLKDGKWGFLSLDLSWVSEPQYDIPARIHHISLATVRKNNLFGIIDLKGNELVPPIYEEIAGFSPDTLALAKKEGKYGVIRYTGEIVIPFVYDHLSLFNQYGVAYFQKGNMFGLINSEGKVVADGFEFIRYSDKYFNENMVFYQFETPDKLYKNESRNFLLKQNGKYGIADQTGNIILPVEFDSVYYTVSSYFSGFFIRKNKLLYKFNLSDRTLVLASEDVLFDGNGFGLVNPHRETCIINRKSEMITPGFFITSTPYKDIVPYQENDLWGLLHISGKILLPPTYYTIQLKDGYGYVSNELNKAGVIDLKLKGREIIPTKHYVITYYDSELKGWWVDAEWVEGEEKQHYYLVNSKGKNTRYTLNPIPRFENGLAIVSKDGKYGIINKKLKNIIPFVYKEIIPSSATVFLVLNNEGKYAIFNNKGQQLTAFSFDYILPFQNDTTYFVRGEKEGLIDTKGNIIIETENLVKSDFILPQVFYNIISQYELELATHQNTKTEHFLNNLLVYKVIMEMKIEKNSEEEDYTYLNEEYYFSPEEAELQNWRYATYTHTSFDPISVMDNFFTILITESKSELRSYTESHLWENYVWNDSVFVHITLFDLFEDKEELMDILNNILVSHLQKLEGVDLEFCAKEDEWVSILEHNFTITQEGLSFTFPLEEREYYYYHEYDLSSASFVVSWEELKSYLKPQIIELLLLN